jgi:hypothetical protein
MGDLQTDQAEHSATARDSLQGQTRKLRKLVFLGNESGGGSVVQLHRCPATVIKTSELNQKMRAVLKVRLPT